MTGRSPGRAWCRVGIVRGRTGRANASPVPTHYHQFVDTTTTDTDLGWDKAARLTSSVTGGVDHHLRAPPGSLELTSAVTSTASTADDWQYKYRQDGTRRSQTTGGVTTSYAYNVVKELEATSTGGTPTTYGWMPWAGCRRRARRR